MEKMTPQPKKLKYRVLISTKGRIFKRPDCNFKHKTYSDWKYPNGTTEQGNQVNYFIPINE